MVNGKKLHISGGDYQLCDGKNVFCCNRLCKRSEESVRKIIIQRKVGEQTALKEAGIRLYGGVKGNADKAIEAYLKGNLDRKYTVPHTNMVTPVASITVVKRNTDVPEMVKINRK